MTIEDVGKFLDARIITEGDTSVQVLSACGSDMMSDVLAYVKNRAVLLTGLVNSQVIRTAQMMDMLCVVFGRSKAPTEDMIKLAQDSGMVLMSTSRRMYEACGILYSNGLKGDGEIDV